MSRDKFNVDKIYETIGNGIEVFMPDIGNDELNECDLSSETCKVTIGDYYQNINRKRNTSDGEIRSNDIHLKKSILNVEATGYFKLVENIDDFGVKLRGGHHSNDSPSETSAKCYGVRIGPDVTTNFYKEYPHPKYSFHSPPGTNRPDLSDNGKWVGMKGIVTNTSDDKVRIEGYYDLDGMDSNGNFDPDKQKWQLMFDTIDDGENYGKDDGDHHSKGVWLKCQENSTVQFRIDGKDTDMEFSSKEGEETFKFCSAREIDPSTRSQSAE
jgi:hypothetical protein